MRFTKSLFLAAVCFSLAAASFIFSLVSSHLRNKDNIIAAEVFGDKEPKVCVNAAEIFCKTRTRKVILKQYSTNAITVRELIKPQTYSATILVFTSCLVIYETTPEELKQRLEEIAKMKAKPAAAVQPTVILK